MKTNAIKNLIVTMGLAFGIMIIPSITANAQVYTGSAGDSATYKYDDVAHTLTISGTGKVKDYFCNEIPEYTIAPDVTINSGITEIGYQAFYRTIGTLEMSNTVDTIDDQAFIGGFAKDMDELNIYATDIGQSSFMRLTKVKKINVVNATSIESSTFGDYSNGTISFSKVTSIASNAFQNFNNVTIELPNTLQSIGTIGSSNKNLLVYGYSNFDSLSSVDFVNYTDLYDMTNKTINLEYTETEYTGSNLQPSVSVTYKLKNRSINIDSSNYTVSYSNNKDMTTAAEVTVTGKNMYNGSISTNFAIYGNMNSASIELSQTNYDVDDKAHEPEVSVTLYGDKLIEGVDYTISYANNIAPGKATVTVSSISNLIRGSKSVYFTINANPINDATVTLNEAIFSYDGSEKRPTPTVVLNGNTLTENVDYKVVYQNNVNVGEGIVSIIGIGNYSGTASVSFNIIKGTENTYEEGEVLISDTYNYSVTSEDEVEFISANKTDATVKIPATITSDDGTVFKVTSIGNKAFYKNSKITSVTIPNTVTSIENNAFYGCKNLKSVKIGNGLEVVGSNSFRKCTKLESITLPKSIDEIGKGAFYGCKNLTKINIKSNEVVDISSNAFKGTSKKIIINVPNKLVKKYQKKVAKLGNRSARFK